jgi:hypothetical protein
MPVELDACFYVDEPPDLEYRNGLFHITQQVGSYRFTRVMRPHTFLQTVRKFSAVAKQFGNDPDKNILAFERRSPEAIDAAH